VDNKNQGLWFLVLGRVIALILHYVTNHFQVQVPWELHQHPQPVADNQEIERKSNLWGSSVSLPQLRSMGSNVLLPCGDAEEAMEESSCIVWPLLALAAVNNRQ
jgi:hypothetical protein